MGWLKPPTSRGIDSILLIFPHLQFSVSLCWFNPGGEGDEENIGSRGGVVGRLKWRTDHPSGSSCDFFFRLEHKLAMEVDGSDEFPFQLRWFFLVPARNFPGVLEPPGVPSVSHLGTWKIITDGRLIGFCNCNLSSMSSFFWLDCYHKQLQTLCSRVMPFLGKDGPSCLILVMTWVENTIPMSINLFLFLFSTRCWMFFWGGIFLRNQPWISPTACQIRRCLGTLPAQPREVRFFFGWELGADRRFYFKKTNMYLQQQQQQQHQQQQQLFLSMLNEFFFLFGFILFFVLNQIWERQAWSSSFLDSLRPLAHRRHPHLASWRSDVHEFFCRSVFGGECNGEKHVINHF